MKIKIFLLLSLLITSCITNQLLSEALQFSKVYRNQCKQTVGRVTNELLKRDIKYKNLEWMKYHISRNAQYFDNDTLQLVDKKAGKILQQMRSIDKLVRRANECTTTAKFKRHLKVVFRPIVENPETGKLELQPTLQEATQIRNDITNLVSLIIRNRQYFERENYNIILNHHTL